MMVVVVEGGGAVAYNSPVRQPQRRQSYSVIGWSERERYMQVLQLQMDAATLLLWEDKAFRVQWSRSASRWLCYCIIQESQSAKTRAVSRLTVLVV